MLSLSSCISTKSDRLQELSYLESDILYARDQYVECRIPAVATQYQNDMQSATGANEVYRIEDQYFEKLQSIDRELQVYDLMLERIQLIREYEGAGNQTVTYDFLNSAVDAFDSYITEN